MEDQKKVSLPSSIDKDALQITSFVNNKINSIAEGWSLLAIQVQEKDLIIKELQKEIKALKGEQDEQTEA